MLTRRLRHQLDSFGGGLVTGKDYPVTRGGGSVLRLPGKRRCKGGHPQSLPPDQMPVKPWALRLMGQSVMCPIPQSLAPHQVLHGVSLYRAVPGLMLQKAAVMGGTVLPMGLCPVLGESQQSCPACQSKDPVEFSS